MNPQLSIAQAMFAIRPKIASNDAIEWEEMPSLLPMEPESTASQPSAAARRATRELARSSSVDFAAWGVTMPAELDTQPVAFREPLSGLAVREVDEPDLFRHFFG